MWIRDGERVVWIVVSIVVSMVVWMVVSMVVSMVVWMVVSLVVSMVVWMVVWPSLTYILVPNRPY